MLQLFETLEVRSILFMTMGMYKGRYLKLNVDASQETAAQDSDRCEEKDGDDYNLKDDSDEKVVCCNHGMIKRKSILFLFDSHTVDAYNNFK